MYERSILGGVLFFVISCVRTSPYLTILALFGVVILFTRLITGYQKAKDENETNSLKKRIPILPYWLPYVGHAPSFAHSFDDLLTYGRDTTKDGIFGLHMLGSKHYMVLMPSLVKVVYLQRPTVLSGDAFLFWTYEKFFGDGGAATKIVLDDFHAVHRSLNYFMKEPFLSVGTVRMVELIQERLPRMISFSDFDKQPHWAQDAGPLLKGKLIEVDLYSLVLNFVGDISVRVVMGHAFLENNPGIAKDFWTFDSGKKLLMSKLPNMTQEGRNAVAARKRLNLAVLEWNQAVLAMLNGEDRPHKWSDLSDVSEAMRLRLKALQSINSDDPFAAASNMGIVWGLMTNANKVIFWMLLSVISSPDILNKVRQDIEPFAKVTEDGKLKLDVNGLVNSCPMLKATFFETLRLYTAGVSYKKVLQDVTLTENAEDAVTFGKPRPQTYHIDAGNYLVIPHATMQMDPRLWTKPARFDPTRFLVPDTKDPTKVRADMLHLNPWGGGQSVCKGRTFAEREVLTFVAGILMTWDFKPVGNGWVIPRKLYNGSGTATPIGSFRVLMSQKV